MTSRFLISGLIFLGIGFYYYDLFDSKIIRDCKVGVLLGRSYFGKRDINNLENMFYQCGANSLRFKFYVAQPPKGISIDESACIFGVGIVLRNYNQVEQGFAFISKHQEEGARLLSECRRRTEENAELVSQN